jgi:hypothetical protein
MTGNRIWLTGDARIVQRRPLVSLQGHPHCHGLWQSLDVSAEAVTDCGLSVEVPAKLISEGSTCSILLDLRGTRNLGRGQLVVQLAFDQETDRQGESIGSPQTQTGPCRFEMVKMEAIPEDKGTLWK